MTDNRYIIVSLEIQIIEMRVKGEKNRNKTFRHANYHSKMSNRHPPSFALHYRFMPAHNGFGLLHVRFLRTKCHMGF